MSKLFKTLFSFSGYTSRKEYWKYMITLFSVFIVIDLIIGTFSIDITGNGFAIFSTALNFFLLSPVIVRRLRDCGWSLWLVVLIFFPFVNWISIIVFGCIKSNAFGYIINNKVLNNNI